MLNSKEKIITGKNRTLIIDDTYFSRGRPQNGKRYALTNYYAHTIK